jgi:hypothetical protein
MTKQQTIELLGQQLPGFYSVEQVIKLISDIEDSGTSKFELDSDQLKQLSSNIADAIENEGTSIIDDYELSMNYKEVELDSIEFETDRMQRTVKDAIEEFINNLINNLNEDEDE